MKTLFSKLNAAIVSHQMAPPVPSKPAEKPDKTPPEMAFLVEGFITRFFFKINKRLKKIRNKPKMISRIELLMCAVKNPPSITNPTDGNPIDSNNCLLMPCLNSTILLKLLDIWYMAVNPRTD